MASVSFQHVTKMYEPDTKAVDDDHDLLPRRKQKQRPREQRGRGARGRGLVGERGVFLRDEPLSNIDAQLRGQTRSEILRLQQLLGITTIYVTHDQVEAMTM